MDVLSQTLFTIAGYPLSLLEAGGVLTGLMAVYLAMKERPVNFIFGMVNNVLYFILFFQFRLYSVMMLQVVYFVFSVYGYYHWKHPASGEENEKREQRINLLSWKKRLIYVGVVVLTGLIWGWMVIHLQAYFPDYFEPPAYPWLDALLTMASVVGQWLLSRKYLDNWILWIVVDVISTILYAIMGMKFTAVMYGVFTIMAVVALKDWLKIYKHYSVIDERCDE
jgi:nicotinamide mononucleotide transporter